MSRNEAGYIGSSRSHRTYLALRTMIVSGSSDVLCFRLSQHRMMERTVISDSRERRIDVVHRDADPGMWMVRHSKKGRFFKKLVSSTWFNSREQAVTFAVALTQKCLGTEEESAV